MVRPRISLLLAILGIVSIAAGALFPMGSVAARTEPRNPPGPGDGTRKDYSDETGKLTFVGASPGRPVDLPSNLDHGFANSQANAAAYVALYGKDFGLENPGKDARSVSTRNHDNGRSTTRYQQHYQGVPVFGGEIVVNLDDQGSLLSMSGEAAPDLSLSTDPSLSAREAEGIAATAIAKYYELGPSDFKTFNEGLWVYDERLIQPGERPARLVYRVEVRGRGGLPIDELVLVDAQRGAIALHFNQIDTAWIAPPSRTEGNRALLDALASIRTREVPQTRPEDASLAARPGQSSSRPGEPSLRLEDNAPRNARALLVPPNCGPIVIRDSDVQGYPTEDGIYALAYLGYDSDRKDWPPEGVNTGYATLRIGPDEWIWPKIQWRNSFELGDIFAPAEVGADFEAALASSGWAALEVSLTLQDLCGQEVTIGDGYHTPPTKTPTPTATLTPTATTTPAPYPTATPRTGCAPLTVRDYDFVTIAHEPTNLIHALVEVFGNASDWPEERSEPPGYVTLRIGVSTWTFDWGLDGANPTSGIVVIDSSPPAGQGIQMGDIFAPEEVGPDFAQALTENGWDALEFSFTIRDLCGQSFSHTGYTTFIPSPEPTSTATPTETETPTVTASPTATTTATITETPTITPTFTVTPTATPLPGGVRRTFTASNGSTLPGTLLCTESQTNCGDSHATAAHRHAADAYDFFRNQHGRDSLDDHGEILVSTVHYDSYYRNAFWNGSQMVYGDGAGFALADDVVAHEITHGFTERESSLFYYYQSGAINESLSDLWGEFVDLDNGTGTDTTGSRWLIGEDVSGLGAMRDMENPPAFGDPDKMTSSLYYKGALDHGGVHWNNGVNNKAVFLMTDGGTFNGRSVRGLGINKVADIYYEAATKLLVSGSDYGDLYNAVYQACLNLVGTDGIESTDCSEVRAALEAVEMNREPAAGFNPEVDICPSGTTRYQTLFLDDFETGLGKWQTGALSGSVNAWGLDAYWTGPFAHSGEHSLYGDDWGGISDSAAGIASDVSIPSGSSSYLRFSHAFGFEADSSGNFDGGILEYRIDGGTWTDASALYSGGKSYGGTIYASSGNPLSGRKAFVGDSHGYVTSRYNLTSLAGHNVEFRWRIGTDWSVGYYGWWVDDVEIYTCVGAPGVPSLVSPASGALIKDYTPTLDWGDTTNAHSYSIQIATDSAFATVVASGTAVPASTFTVPGDEELDPNRTYYWRVKASNATGVESAWSATRTFRTAVEPPVLVSPADAAPIDNKRPSFDWDNVTGATGYTLQIATNPAFSAGLVSVSTTGATASSYARTADLLASTTYYWRVQAKATNGPSAWSPTWSFTTGSPPSIPSLVAPADNALSTNYAPRLDWSDATGGLDQYQLQIATNSAFTTLVLDQDVSPPSELTLTTPLDPNTTFYWRVRSLNAAGHYSAWSTTRRLRTSITIPVLAEPSDAASLLNKRPVFDWESVEGASSYAIKISANGNLSSPVVSTTVYTSAYAVTKDLAPAKTYYWAVQGKGANGPSLWSPAWWFTTGSPPSIPSLVAPADNSLSTNYAPRLDWSDATGGLDHYQLQIATNSAFTTLVLDQDVSPPSDFTLSTPLDPNTTFYWRVRSLNAAGHYSAWSSTRNLRTAITAPVLLDPAEAASLLNKRPTFDWDNVPGATGYTIQVSPNASLASPVVNASVSSSAYAMTKDLLASKTYYWRIQAKGANGPSLWSTTWSFTTGSPASIPSLVAPADNSLSTNYAPRLDWSDATGGLDHYQLQIATNSAFTALVLDQDVSPPSELTLTTPLDPNSTFYWRVRSLNAAGHYSAWSSTRRLRTAIAAPLLSEPADVTDTDTRRPTFSWASAAGASGYTIQISTNGLFTSTVVNASLTGVGALSYTPTVDLPTYRVLTWRVRANGPNGPSVWSQVRSLIITP